MRQVADLQLHPFSVIHSVFRLRFERERRMSGVSASPPPTFYYSFEWRPKTRSFCCHQSLPHPNLRFNSLAIGFPGGRLQRDRVVLCNSSTNPPPPASGTHIPLCDPDFFLLLFFSLDLEVKVPCSDGICMFMISVFHMKH